LGKGLAGKSATQRATKVAAGGFPVAVGCHRAIELTNHPRRRSRKIEIKVSQTRMSKEYRSSIRSAASNSVLAFFFVSQTSVQSKFLGEWRLKAEQVQLKPHTWALFRDFSKPVQLPGCWSFYCWKFLTASAYCFM
jgi:hypothetical protein